MDLREKLAALDEADAPKNGVQVAEDLLARAKPLVNSAYLRPPVSMPRLAGTVIEAID